MQSDQPPVAPPPVFRRLECSGTLPGPRCGHTLTYTAPDIHGNARLILLGGATSLDSGAGAGRLGGATSDAYSYDLATGVWSLLESVGERPSPRAAHATAAVGNMLVVQGGIGPTGLASGDLHVLDLNSEICKWHRVNVQGPGPGARYAHTMALVGKRYLVCIGGNDGRKPLNDVWTLDTASKPYVWVEVHPEGVSPPPRMYAACSTRMDGLLLLCGGRDAQNVVFIASRLIMLGGALGGGRMVKSTHNLAVLDTATGGWWPSEADIANQVKHPSADLFCRCRHATTVVGNVIFLYGGLNAGVLLGDMLVAEDGVAATSSGKRASTSTTAALPGGSIPVALTPAGEATSRPTSLFPQGGYQQQQQQQLQTQQQQLLQQQQQQQQAAQQGSDERQRNQSPLMGGGEDEYTGGIRLYHRAVVVAAEMGGELGGLVRQLSLDALDHEARRVNTPMRDRDEDRNNLSPLMGRKFPSLKGIHKLVLKRLLQPREWVAPQDYSFFLNLDQIEELCGMAENFFKQCPNVLQLAAPIKIFGDLHGQFGDMMRLFDEYGSPSPAGDISYIDYLFLGDYVDRGMFSLETICLLLALKIEHPTNIHLLRGNHEAKDINKIFGFKMECETRLGEHDGKEAWKRFNKVFNWMPLAAMIENKIICMHGGIGRSIERLSDIEELKRPLKMKDGGEKLMDLLWSDPTESDAVQGYQANTRGPGLICFGPDRVIDFCRRNNVQMIVRAHECVMDGFERFAQGHLITVFSATNYCGTANNAGAILVLGRDLMVVPKLIHPLPPAVDAYAGDLDASGSPDTWMVDINERRPPTPPRGRPHPASQRSPFAP
eukprot:jgi/Mesvir1/8161/Mv12469-RA.2